MNGPRRKNLVLILAREFASNLATSMFVMDADGNLVFFNEPAEEILGRRFAESREMKATEWAKLFSPEALDGTPLAPEALPGGIAFSERRPTHDTFRITGLDGQKREIAATAFPLLGRADEFLGVVAIFWERGQDGAG